MLGDKPAEGKCFILLKKVIAVDRTFTLQKSHCRDSVLRDISGKRIR